MPSLFVLVETDEPLLELDTVTEAFWITAPLWSFMVPEMLPVSTCACAMLAKANSMTARYLKEDMAVEILEISLKNGGVNLLENEAGSHGREIHRLLDATRRSTYRAS